MTQSEKKKWFGIAGCVFIVLMVIATVSDLSISNHFIQYNSIFGTVFQSVGEFPVYFVFVLSGQVAMRYALELNQKPLTALPLLLGGFALVAWQTKQYLNEVASYLLSVQANLAGGKAIGLANSDSNTATLSPVVDFILWLALIVIVTFVAQTWLAKKSTEELKKLMMVAVFASLAVWFALEVNLALKDYWGRFRPYELSHSQKEFTSWLHPNGINGHKSFPSGHTMAGTLFILFSWFATGKSRVILWRTGVVYGALMGISRVRIGAHFLSDVTFSFFLTALILFIVQECYQHLVAPEAQLVASKEQVEGEMAQGTNPNFLS